MKVVDCISCQWITVHHPVNQPGAGAGNARGSSLGVTICRWVSVLKADSMMVPPARITRCSMAHPGMPTGLKVTGGGVISVRECIMELVESVRLGEHIIPPGAPTTLCS